jgi:uncharacterized protein YutE (UPF0331/DUF86 family)
MKERISGRFEALIKEGHRLVSLIGSDSHGPKFWVETARIPIYQAWIASASNLIRVVIKGQSHYIDEYKRLMENENMRNGIPAQVVTKLLGLLTSAQLEWSSGLLREIDYIIAAETFDDFLDHAVVYHKANKKIEAAVLGSAVFEDTVKKLAVKNGIETKEKTLDPLIDELASEGILTPVKAKRLKAYAGVRNKALHAEWDSFDIKDVGEMISGVRELIEQYL